MTQTIAGSVREKIWDATPHSRTLWPSDRSEELRVRSSSSLPDIVVVEQPGALVRLGNDVHCLKDKWLTTSVRPRVLDFELPAALAHLQASVESSRWMLDLPDNWDEEGAPSYAVETWEAAIRFLVKNALTVWRIYDFAIPAPQVQNGPDGSIDLFWESATTTLLINIPVNSDDPISFYGAKNEGHTEIRGDIEADKFNPIALLWTME